MPGVSAAEGEAQDLAGTCGGRSEALPQWVVRLLSLSWYFRTLSGAGFLVLGLEEPAPTAEFAQGEAGDSWPNTPFLEQIPLHCILDACKINRR